MNCSLNQKLIVAAKKLNGRPSPKRQIRCLGQIKHFTRCVEQGNLEPDALKLQRCFRGRGIMVKSGIATTKGITTTRYASTSTDNTVRSPAPDVDIPNETLPEFIWKNVEKFPDHTALECGVTGRSYTFREALAGSRKFGAALLKSGLKPGDVLAVMLPNMPEYALILLGALESGLLVSTINPIYTKNEIIHQVKTAGAKCIVTLPSLVPLIKEVLQNLESKAPIITVSYDEGRDKDSWDFYDMINSGVDESVIRNGLIKAEDIAILPFSSGTTGLSKGVSLTHRNIVVNLMQIGSPCVSTLRETTLEHQDIMPACLPFFHIYGMVIQAFQGLARGAKVVTLPKFEPQTYLNILSTHKPLTAVCYCVPALIMFLGSHPLVKTEHVRSIRVLTNGAGPVGPSDFEKVIEKVPNVKDIRIINAYGLTETSPVIFKPFKGDKDLISVGRPMPNTHIRIVDPSGKNLGPDENGEIYVRGPQVMKGYYKNEKANAEAFENEWFKTGDVAYYNKEGMFFIVERLKELIKVKGFQVPPAELEAILRGHPHVEDVGVIGVPDDKKGEKPIAYVVQKPGVNFETEKICDYVAEQVAPFKRLGGIILTDKIPRNPTGKILRKELREVYRKGH